MYNGQLAWPTRRLGRIIGEMSKAGVSIGRLREILLAAGGPGQLAVVHNEGHQSAAGHVARCV